MELDTEVLKEVLMEELKTEVYDEWGSAFREDDPPSGRIITECVGPWLWIKARIEYEGTTMDQSTDRLSGDPESAHAWRDWIGLAESAPTKVSRPEELDSWALFTATYRRTYRDIQVPAPWGHHSGRWVEELTEDGEVKVRVVVSRNFHDVSPESMTKIERVQLKK